MNLRHWIVVLSLVLSFGTGVTDAQSPRRDRSPNRASTRIEPEKAHEYVGKTVTVEMTVRSTKKSDTSERYFLDSETDYKSPTNFAVVIPYETAASIEKKGIKDIVADFLDKKIRVTGRVVRSSDQTRIYVNEPGQIELLGDRRK